MTTVIDGSESSAGALEGHIRSAVILGARHLRIHLGPRSATADILTYLRDLASAFREGQGTIVVVTDDASVHRLLRLTFLDRAFTVIGSFDRDRATA